MAIHKEDGYMWWTSWVVAGTLFCAYQVIFGAEDKKIKMPETEEDGESSDRQEDRTGNILWLYGAEGNAFLRIQGEPFILPVAQGRMMKLVIVAFAAFFVTVFLAFALNAIRNIKADPQASKILSEAWKAGK